MEPTFKAPPPPPSYRASESSAPAQTPPSSASTGLTDAVVAHDRVDDNIEDMTSVMNTKKNSISLAWLEPKRLIFVLGGVFLVGLIFGGMMFGGSSAPPRSSGLEGVIANPDITQAMPRCGRVDRSAPCILYLVNHTNYDRYAEDFFDEAVSKMGRQKFLVTVENPKYAKLRIPPGSIAQIKIPQLR